MFRSGGVLREVLFGLRRHARSLLLYHLFFTILASLLLIPASSWLLTTLLNSAGKPAVTNFDILAFLLSPMGLAWLLVAATLTLTWIIADQAGMIVIAASAARGRTTAAMAALWHIGRRLPRFLALTGLRACPRSFLGISSACDRPPARSRAQRDAGASGCARRQSWSRSQADRR